MPTAYIMVPLIGGPKHGEALRYNPFDIPYRLTVRDNRTGTIGYYVLMRYTRPEGTYWYFLLDGTDTPADYQIIGLLIAHAAIPIESVRIFGQPAHTPPKTTV